MGRDAVSELILGKLSEKIAKDSLFNGFSEKLISLLKQRATEKEIKESLGKEPNEDSKSGH
jgi:hypothetical protein